MTAQIIPFPTKDLNTRADDLFRETLAVYEAVFYLVMAAVEMQLAILNAQFRD